MNKVRAVPVAIAVLSVVIIPKRVFFRVVYFRIDHLCSQSGYSRWTGDQCFVHLLSETTQPCDLRQC